MEHQEALTSQKEATQLYRERLHLVYTHAADLLVYLDSVGKITQLPKEPRFLIQNPGLLNVGDLIVSRLDNADGQLLTAAIAAVIASNEPQQLDVWLTGNTHCLRCRVAAIPPGKGVLLTAMEVTEWKKQESALFHQATHDELTGLPNRKLLLERVDQLIAGANRKPATFALLLLDLDGFKRVNDTLGHSAGDLLLEDTAARLRAVIREEDTVARLGGDEFVVLVADCENEGVAARVASRVNEAVREPYRVLGELVHVSASIGAAMFPIHGDNNGELLKNADVAMYQAKSLGKDQYVTYDPAWAEALSALTMEAEMHLGIERGEFYLEYQPIYSPQKTLLGCEALMRWKKTNGESVPPGVFIPIAESSGLIGLMGNWALRVATFQAASWRRLFGASFYVTVNVSPSQVTDEKFVARVESALAEAGLPPGSLVLEITEGVMMQDPKKTCEFLQNLKKIGVLTAVDDFGTGYSSLAYLKQLPVSTLKIDRAFIIDVATNPHDQAIVSAVLHLAAALGLTVVAEGVETAEQLEFLHTHNCPAVQGWLFGKPAIPPLFEKENSIAK